MKLPTFYFRFMMFVFFATMGAAQDSENAMAKIEQLENNSDGLGQYSFKFLTSNNIERSESGRLEDGNYIVQGYYSFVADNGKKYYVTYYADKTGYHPTVVDSEPPAIENVVYSAAPPGVVASLLG